ncbi:MAG: HEAT repeat domain-containing protein [Bacteroidota bacterium]|jgi:HEAT repeat protein
MIDNETKQLVITLLSDTNADMRRDAAERLSASSSLMVSAVLSLGLQDPDKGVRDSVARSLLEMRSPSVPYAIVEYLTDSSFITRNLASTLLVQIGKNSLHALIPYFQHENQDVRKLALDTAGLIGDGEIVHDVLPLLNDADENVVVAAVEALGNIRAISTLPHLAVSYSCHPFARVVIAEAIGKIGDRSAAPYLISLLRSYKKPEGEELLELFSIVEALAGVGDESSLPAIAEMVRSGDAALHNILLYALVSIVQRYSLSPLRYEEYRNQLLNALNDSNGKIVMQVIQALAAIADGEIEEKLLQKLGKNDAIDALILKNLRNGKKAFSLLVGKYETGDRNQKKSIVHFLLPHLQENMGHWFSEIQYNGMKPLQRSASSYFDLLALDWREADEEMRTEIMDTLLYLDQDRALTYFTQLAEEADSWTRMEFLEQIAGSTHPRANDVLLKFAGDDNDFVREFVHSILQSRGLSFSNPEFTE